MGLFCASLAFAQTLVLTSDNFASVVGGSKPALVKFYAPWCGHCKALAPVWEKLGEAYQGKDMTIAKVDCTEEADLCQQHDVKGYPTLIFFAAGDKKGERYDQGREAEAFVQYIADKTGVQGEFPVEVVFVNELTPATFDNVVNDENNDVFVSFVAPWCGHCKQLHPTWDQLAENYRNDKGIVIARLNADAHRSIAEKFQVSGFPTIKMFRRGAKSTPETYEGERSIEGLSAHVAPSAGVLRQANGRLAATEGRIAELDDLAADFADGNVDDLLAKAQKYAEANPGRSAKLYIHTMTKQKADPTFVDREVKRLSDMITSGMVPHDRRDDMDVRLNILKAFQQI